MLQLENILRHWRVIICFLVHGFLFWAVFDVYYKSPLVHGMTPHGEMPDDSAAASRLVLFVADGLRAHSLYTNLSRTPFLKKVISEFGSWGVSHTRVPTESRPGHVAMIAGFYEDVAAVTKGWRENPVEFDSIFNESRYTWSWGSPDILPMFSKGATGNHVFTSCYDSAIEDFGSSDPSKLDTWVFERVQSFFNSPNESVSGMLRQNKIIVFLHLLGLDTSGHGYKPLSSEYSKNIQVVDEGVSAMYDLIEQFYGHDGRTAYVFTSDHGMTDWGSHGSGDDHETMTPFIAWGSGIARPTTSSSAIIPDVIMDTKSKNTLGRKDLNQADVAPLISALIGINMPMNSVGQIPVDYLNVSQRYAASAICSNFDQLVEQMQVQRRRKYDSSFRLLFKEYPDLTSTKLQLIKGEIGKLFAQKRFTAAAQLCRQWSGTVVDALHYYHQYERPFLIFCVALTFALLELCIWRFATETTIIYDHAVSAGIMLGIAVTTSLTVSAFWICSFPLARYLYGLTPIFLAALSQPIWKGHLARLWTSVAYLRDSHAWVGLLKWIGSILVGYFMVELLVWVFSYRWILSIGLWTLSIWPNWYPRIGWSFRASWLAICLVMSIFPFLPTVGRSSNPDLVFYTCVVIGICLVFVYVIWKLGMKNKNGNTGTEGNGIIGVEDFIFGLLFLSILASGCVNLTTSTSIQQRRGSPALNRIISWIILMSSPWIVCLMPINYTIRLVTLCLALFSPFALMSVNYEPLFYVCLSTMLYLWLNIEERLERPNDRFVVANRPLSIEDIRRAYFFVFFILLSFFGTGNIASINSFDPSFISSFITVFSPFVMGALLLTKIAIPFFIVCSFLCGLEKAASRNIEVLFWLIVMISDGMALRFFFQLRDHGSWLDIGTSISHFVISSSITLIVMVLYHLAKLALTKSFLDTDDQKWHVL